MTYVVWLALGVIGLFAGAAWLAIWSRRDTWARPAAVVLFLAGMPTIALAAIESLGWHRPIELVWDLDRATTGCWRPRWSRTRRSTSISTTMPGWSRVRSSCPGTTIRQCHPAGARRRARWRRGPVRDALRAFARHERAAVPSVPPKDAAARAGAAAEGTGCQAAPSLQDRSSGASIIRLLSAQLAVAPPYRPQPSSARHRGQNTA
jgi:hypothetical protein